MSLIFIPAVTCAALFLYVIVVINVARSRMKHKIVPPVITGPPEFERYFRVQQNTLEQIVLFLPALWLFGVYVSDPVGAMIGAVWIVARSFYAWGYYTEAPKRMPGFVIGQLATATLLFGAVWGIVSGPLAHYL